MQSFFPIALVMWAQHHKLLATACTRWTHGARERLTKAAAESRKAAEGPHPS